MVVCAIFARWSRIPDSQDGVASRGSLKTLGGVRRFRSFGCVNVTSPILIHIKGPKVNCVMQADFDEKVVLQGCGQLSGDAVPCGMAGTITSQKKWVYGPRRFGSRGGCTNGGRVGGNKRLSRRKKKDPSDPRIHVKWLGVCFLSTADS